MRVRIPAEVQREDRLIAGLTARQLAITAGVAATCYLAWFLTRAVIPAGAAVAIGAVLVGATLVLVLGRRDEMSLDRYLWAALRFARQPRHRTGTTSKPQSVPGWLSRTATSTVAAPAEGIELPAQGVDEAGVIDLGDDGLAMVATCSTVNFALRAEDEQHALIAGFARYLHTLTTSAQLLLRTHRWDLSASINDLAARAPDVPDPGLARAAGEHAEFLNSLSQQTTLLRRQVLLILREPARHGGNASGEHAAYRAAAARLSRRITETADILAGAGITITPLVAEAAAAVLASACVPDRAVATDQLAPADAVITTTGADHP